MVRATRVSFPGIGEAETMTVSPSFYLDVLVLAVGDSDQGRGRLSLSAGGDDYYLIVRQLAGLVHGDQGVFRDAKVTQVPGHLDVVDHAPSDDGDLAVVPDGGVDNLLDARDEGGERGDHHAAGGLGDLAVERLADDPLGGSVAVDLGVGGVGAEEQYALVGHPRKGGEVGPLPVLRRVVDLEVAGVNHESKRGPDGNAHGVRYGVAYPEELDAELADGERLVGLDDVQSRVGEPSVLAKLDGDEAVRQARRVDGHVESIKDVGQSADMVLVTVCDEDGLDLVAVLDEV